MNVLSILLNSVLLGVGLAMDAFSVSLANGLNDPKMKRSKMCVIAGVFAVFQTAMPLIGWFCVHMLVEKFKAFEKYIPWIALFLLVYIGGKMLTDGIKENHSEEKTSLRVSDLLIQGIATSIDALSVGFTIADFSFLMALVETTIIGLVTFAICIGGLVLGRQFGTKFSSKASIFGGVILILIGVEIFVKGVIL